jgi:hypothetical protein
VTDLPDFDGDDDTGKIRLEASRKPASDPGSELRGLTVAFIQHEVSDATRWKVSLWAFGLMLSAALAVCAYALNAAAETGGDRATMQDMHDRMVRIEGLLMERTR